MSSESIIIPQFYSGFRKDLDISDLLKLTKGLCVITGDNGSGKTQILKYIHNHLRKTHKKDSILFKIPQFENTYKQRIPRYIYEEEELNAQNFLKKIILSKASPISSLIDLGNLLFDSQNYHYNQEIRVKIITKMANYILDSFQEEQYLKFSSAIGHVTQYDIKKATITLYKKEHPKIRLTPKKKEEIKTWYDSSDNAKKEEIQKIAKEDLRVPTIKSLDELVNHLNELFDPLNNNENILQKLAKIIEDDYLTKTKPEKNSILANINNHIDEINCELNKNQIKAFDYKLAKPVTGIDYELSFIQKNNNNSKIHLKDLSTGERALFELLFYAYSHSSKKEKVKYFLLDEFDANFNPTLIKSYIYLLNSLKDKIKIIITTHNPITVFNANYNEIYELDREQCYLSSTKTKADKKAVLNKLAPDFIHDTELGFIGILSKKTEDTIILCEGDTDKFYLEHAMEKLNKKYTIIDCYGAENVKHFVMCFKTIPMLRDLINLKKIVALFDFDTKGYEVLKNLAKKEFTNNNYKAEIKINNDDKINSFIYAMALTPHNYTDYNISSADKSWEIEHLFIYSNNEYKGKQLTKDDKNNIKKEVMENKYNDYTKFQELFNEIDTIENDAKINSKNLIQ